MKRLFLLFAVIAPLLWGQSAKCELISQEGQVRIRPAYQEGWSAIREGDTLASLATVWTSHGSRAVFKTGDGSEFILPANARIEIRELKQLSRDEVIMELTALELQKLPGSDETERPARAFVLHGSPPEIDDENSRLRYLTLEENGAVALFEQGFISGFIIKWNRLHYQFPGVKLSEADRLIESAYEQMNMPARLKAVKQ